jgi:S-adenosylmethionine:tRNA ribosyltransferase-isomerase
MSKSVYSLADFDFDLPEHLIAQFPLERRDASRLLVLDRYTNIITHEIFTDIVSHLRSGDLLVFNDSRVIPARMFFKRESGGVVEFVLVRRMDERRWLAISNRSARLSLGERLSSVENSDVAIHVLSREGEYFSIETDPVFTQELLERIGKVPLPPYIRREPTDNDHERYQTIYAKNPGGVAAPTAGLHFTPDLFARLDDAGIERVFVTLDVSWGTFQPVRQERIEDHAMHTESFEIREDVSHAINRARIDKRRIVAVGTTSLRVLESAFQNGETISGRGETSIFIFPPYEVKSVDALITNFHTPKSTLLMLVAAFAGYDLIMRAYREAVREEYRFFSYGDAMFIS